MSAKERDLGTSPRMLTQLAGSTVPIRLGCYLAFVPVLCPLIGWMQVIRYIEGDFDAYVKRIQQPFMWSGEPELLMASHILK
ncbi:hypothetical protein E5676_scaffold506G00240 [Cucumis melo var. makuwa]|uniref:Uncharacterized protein n=1 Tax=Cucumis melo var. makuwa TaxID=1194695 RepID=A0A5D3BDA7_CUCMM|nr:hypothetical protein E5676_scaffold506G00240 [Cucumis melo var. makuwa]